jgi:hypothetical protein
LVVSASFLLEDVSASFLLEDVFASFLLDVDGTPPAPGLKRAGNTFPHPTTKLC